MNLIIQSMTMNLNHHRLDIDPVGTISHLHRTLALAVILMMHIRANLLAICPRTHLEGQIAITTTTLLFPVTASQTQMERRDTTTASTGLGPDPQVSNSRSSSSDPKQLRLMLQTHRQYIRMAPHNLHRHEQSLAIVIT